MKRLNWLILTTGLALFTATAAAAWQPARGPLVARWAKDVKPEKAWPEYPCPQMVRAEWQNLNGLLDTPSSPKIPRGQCNGPGKSSYRFPLSQPSPV